MTDGSCVNVTGSCVNVSGNCVNVTGSCVNADGVKPHRYALTCVNIR